MPSFLPSENALFLPFLKSFYALLKCPPFFLLKCPFFSPKMPSISPSENALCLPFFKDSTKALCAHFELMPSLQNILIPFISPSACLRSSQNTCFASDVHTWRWTWWLKWMLTRWPTCKWIWWPTDPSRIPGIPGFSVDQNPGISEKENPGFFGIYM